MDIRIFDRSVLPTATKLGR